MKRISLLLFAGLLWPLLASAQQIIPFEGIENGRDLGGIVVQDSLQIRTGLLLRTANLSEATEGDIQYLTTLPLTHIFDFQLDSEKEEHADKDIPGAKHIDLPIDVNTPIKAKLTEPKKKKRHFFSFLWSEPVKIAFDEQMQQAIRLAYPTAVDDSLCQRQFAAFLRQAIDADGALLYHCAWGKDRTGIATALLLSALGVDRDTIIADFDISNRPYDKYIKRYSRRIRFWGGGEDEIATVKAAIGVNTDNFVKLLDYIDTQYGSMDAYLRGPMGLTDADIQTLRARCLERR